MSLTPQQLAELDSLLSDLADERLSEERRLVLEGLLQSEPEARDYYIRFLALCSDLHESAATCLSVENEDGPHVAASLRDADAGLGETGPRGSLGRRWPAWIAMVTAVAVLAAVIVSTRRPSGSGTANLPEAQPVVGHIFDIVGLVEIAAEELSGTPATDGMPVRSGEALLTKGADSHVAIRLDDGTVIMLAGDTRVAFPLEDRDRLDVEYGNVTATVQPRPAGHPLVVCTREAQLEVLGTRLSVACGDRRTRVDVLEGDIRVTRLSDQRSVALAGGQSAEVSPQADLKSGPHRRGAGHLVARLQRRPAARLAHRPARLQRSSRRVPSRRSNRCGGGKRPAPLSASQPQRLVERVVHAARRQLDPHSLPAGEAGHVSAVRRLPAARLRRARLYGADARQSPADRAQTAGTH